MFKLTILLIFCFNTYHCYKQQSSDYGSGQSQQKSSLLKPQAIIHLPENVYSHKLTDTIKLDHEQLSNYLSSINYIPHTIHKHAELLAQLNPEDIKKYGQSIGSNQLPLISLTVPDKNSDYSSGDAQMKINDDYSAPQKDAYQAPQSNSGYQQQQNNYNQPQQEYAQPQQEYSQPKQQEYAQPQQEYSQPKQQEYAQPQQEYSQPKQQEYAQPQQEYSQPKQQEYAQPQQEYSQPKQQSYNSPPPSPMKKNCHKNSGYQQKQNSQEQYGNNQGGNYEQGGNSYEANQGYNKPQVEYQSGGGHMENNQGNSYEQQGGGNNYDSGNSYYSGNSNSYEQNENSYENNQGNSYEQQGGGNSYENNQNSGGQSYQSNNQDYGGSKSTNEGNDYAQNYESSPFDYNFVQDILHHVMQQLEQLQIDPDQLNAYGKTEEGNGDNYQSNGGSSGGYESNGNQQSGGYEVQGGNNGIQLVDKPEGSQEINYGYSINHGSYEQPNEPSNSGYEPNGYTSSSTTSQATSYSEPAVVLDNKLPINQIVNKDQSGATVTYQMPTVNIELDKKKIEHIMKAISNNNNKKGSYSQPIMIKANQFKLPSNLNLGKIKTIAFISGSKLKGLSQLPYLNSQLLGNNLIDSNYKLISSTSKKDETKYESNQPLSAYGYGILASSSNKKSVVLPIPSIKKRSKILSRSSQSLQTASSNIKKTIISALPKLSKNKKSVKKP